MPNIIKKEEERRPRLLYIAHPLRGDDSAEWGDKNKNFERYLKIVRETTLAGYAVISWAHFELLHQRGLKKDGSFWLRLDKALLRAADEMWVCGPLEVSSGMREEVVEATKVGVPIRYTYLENDLLPCPFCGCKPEIRQHSWRDESVRIGCTSTWDDTVSCPASTTVTADSVEQAVKKWNTRP